MSSVKCNTISFKYDTRKTKEVLNGHRHTSETFVSYMKKLDRLSIKILRPLPFGEMLSVNQR
jgi:hypothetical protein